MKLASIVVVLVGLAVAIVASFVAGQLILAGVLLAVMYAVGNRKPKRRSLNLGPKAVIAKRTAEEARAEVPLAVALLIPLALIAEKLDVQSRAVAGHHAIAVYAAAAWAYYGSDHSSTEPFTDTAKAALVTAAIGSAALGALTLNVATGCAVIVGMAVALETFMALRTAVPAAEAHLVAGLCLVVAVDAVTNNYVASNQQHNLAAGTAFKLDLKQTTGASVEHVLGRGCLVAAWLFAVLLRRVFAVIRPASALKRNALAAGIALAALAISAAHVYVALYVIGDASPQLKEYIAAFVGDVPPTWAVLHDRTAFISSFRSIFVGLWLVLIPCLCALAIALSDAIPRIVRRKAFHLLALVAFLMPNVIDPQFLALWWCVAIGLATVVETTRVHGLLLSDRLTEALQRVVDDRDGGIIRTHIYLMVGCALPVLLNYRVSFRMEAKVPWFVTSLRDTLPGLGALGVLDSVAAAAGVLCGTVKLCWLVGKVFPESWRSDNPALAHKSFAGTAAGTVAFCVFAFLPLLIIHVIDMGSGAGARLDAFAVPWPVFARVFGVAAITAIYEAITEGVDNLELPIFCATVTRLIL